MALFLATVGGQLARNQGIAQANANAHPAWKAAVAKIIYELPSGWIGIGEDIRLKCLAAKIPAPHHVNCWGAQIWSAILRRELESLNGYRHMQVKRSHSRKSPLLRRTKWI